MSLPIFPQPAADRRLCRAGADTMAKWIGAARTGRIEIGQSEAAIHHDPAGLAMVAASADVGIEPVVSRACEASWRARPEDGDRRPGAQAPRRTLEILVQRGGHQGRDDESCLSARITVLLFGRILIRS